MALRFFEQGGGRFFVSVTTGRTREARYYSGTDCVLLKTWNDVLDYLCNLAPRIAHESHLELIEIFTKPRLCRNCLNHASQPEMFDVTAAVQQCLCWVEKNPACPVHKFGEK